MLFKLSATEVEEKEEERMKGEESVREKEWKVRRDGYRGDWYDEEEEGN